MLQKFYSASGLFCYIFVQSLAQYTNIIKHNGSTFESEQSSRRVRQHKQGSGITSIRALWSLVNDHRQAI